ncbi:MAG: hypothetical protein GY749_30790 [Desulfobacteraceae bacterium]|nr:hypothetical protein [Desulfobacteraceae bacterium]
MQNRPGVLVDNENGSYTYIPDTGFTGTDRFACTVSDENGFVSTGMVSIEVGDTVLASILRD